MFPIHHIDPVAISLGPLKIHWYGLMYVLGMFVAWRLALSRLRAGRLPVSEAALGDLVYYAMFGVLLGGRLGYLVFYGWQQVLDDPLYALRIWEGGMSFHGGLIGVMTAGWIWSRKQGLHYFDTVDFVAAVTPPGLGFGRIGNFIGGELWGRTTDVPWAMIFPASLPPEYARLPYESLQKLNESGALDAYARHPSQLYQAFLEGAVLFVLVWFFTRKPRPRYAASGLFALGYGVFRFAVEFVRQPDAQLGFLAFDWLTMGQLLSLPLIAIGIVLLWLSRRAPTLANAA